MRELQNDYLFNRKKNSQPIATIAILQQHHQQRISTIKMIIDENDG